MITKEGSEKQKKLLLELSITEDKSGDTRFVIRNEDDLNLEKSELKEMQKSLTDLESTLAKLLNGQISQEKLSEYLKSTNREGATELFIYLYQMQNDKRINERYKKLVEEFGSSSALVNEKLNLLAYKLNTNITILLLGEPRVGKTWLAKAIHKVTRPTDNNLKKFKNVSVANFPDEMLQSELFGHKKGSFTGATSDKKGLFAEAEGGTILLDDIDSASPRLQASLLKVVNERVYLRLGDTEEQKLKDVRIVFATNKDLSFMVENKSFREDLFYRLSNGITFNLPPLRERLEDIPIYAQKFAKELWVEGSLPIEFRAEDYNKLKRLSIGRGNLDDLKKIVNDLYYKSLKQGFRHIEIDNLKFNNITELETLENEIKKYMQKWDHEKNGNFLEHFLHPVVAKVSKEVFTLTTKNAAKIIGLGKDSKGEDGLTTFDRASIRYEYLTGKLNDSKI